MVAVWRLEVVSLLVMIAALLKLVLQNRCLIFEHETSAYWPLLVACVVLVAGDVRCHDDSPCVDVSERTKCTPLFLLLRTIAIFSEIASMRSIVVYLLCLCLQVVVSLNEFVDTANNNQRLQILLKW